MIVQEGVYNIKEGKYSIICKFAAEKFKLVSSYNFIFKQPTFQLTSIMWGGVRLGDSWTRRFKLEDSSIFRQWSVIATIFGKLSSSIKINNSSVFCLKD